MGCGDDPLLLPVAGTKRWDAVEHGVLGKKKKRH